MQKRENVSMSVIRRLPRYYRFLYALRDKGVTRISSTELSAKLGLTASQIGRASNCFGGFGQQGYGYIVSQLCDAIANILGISNRYGTILIGAGNLGRAIAAHMSFQAEGFHLLGIFDISPDKIGKTLASQTIQDVSELENFCREKKPVMAVLCVPREAVGSLIERLHDLGILYYWNFSHYDIKMRYPDTVVENVHLNDSLMTLCYRISNPVHKA